MLLRVAGLVTFLALAALDALAPHWDPAPWSYASPVILVVWGPQLLGVLGRKP